MEKERLNEANRLNKLIEEHEKALYCFEYDANESIGKFTLACPPLSTLK